MWGVTVQMRMLIGKPSGTYFGTYPVATSRVQRNFSKVLVYGDAVEVPKFREVLKGVLEKVVEGAPEIVDRQPEVSAAKGCRGDGKEGSFQTETAAAWIQSRAVENLPAFHHIKCYKGEPRPRRYGSVERKVFLVTGQMEMSII